MPTRPLGLAFTPLERRRELIVDLTVRAEELGYDRVAIGEGWTWDVHLHLAEIASRTSTIKLHSSVASAYGRSSASLAMAAATLAAQSGGRYALGLGASTKALTEGFHDVEYRAPVEVLRRRVEQTRALLAGERHELERDARALRLGTDSLPAVPVYVGALSPRALRLTGELGEGWLPFLVPPSKIAEFMARIDEGRPDRAPELGETIHITPAIPTAVSADADIARAAMNGLLSTYMIVMAEFYGPFLGRLGFASEVEAIQEANERPGDGIMPASAERLRNEQTICGAPAEAREQLETWYAAGVDQPTVMMVPGAPEELLHETIESLAPGG